MKIINPKQYKDSQLLIGKELNKNNFDFLRFILATAVIYSHCFVIYFGVVKDTEPISIFTKNQADLGGLAVCSFFVISGFLIVRSFEYSVNSYEYFVKRFLRIVPGFFVAYLISVLIFGSLGTLNLNNQIWELKYYFDNLNIKQLLLRLFTLEAPRGIKTFSINPLPNMVNESCWTIQYEALCYLIVPLSLLGFKKRKSTLLVVFVIFYLVLLLQTFNVITFVDNTKNLILLYPSEVPKLLSFFLSGACCYFYRHYIPRNIYLASLSFTLIIVASVWFPLINLVLPFAGTYLLFYLAYHPYIQLHSWAKKGDFSYGLYLYGWPLQQLVMYFFAKHINVQGLFLIAFPIAFLAAYFSWHIVEKPFLKLKGAIKEKMINNKIAFTLPKSGSLPNERK